MGVTIHQVAEIAGVSTCTVSLALRNSPRVKERTKTRIVAVAKELNYRPNALGRALSLQKSSTIGVTLPDISNPFYSRITQGIEEVTSKFGYHVILCNTKYDLEKEANSVHAMLGRKIDGLIISPVESVSYDYLKELKREGIPFVSLRRLPVEEVDYVMANDEEAAYELTKHLISLGYKRIGYIGNTKCGFTDHDRLLGYRRALQDQGLTYDETRVVETGFGMKDGYRASMNLLTRDSKPRAIIAFSDILAMGILLAAKELGIKVPQELAVVGFDDIEFSQSCLVPLTTMALPKYDIGARAAGLLIRKIEQRQQTDAGEISLEEVHRIVLKCKLIIRESCGAYLKIKKR